MSSSKPPPGPPLAPRDNPNATIQLSAIDAAELVQFEAAEEAAAAAPRSRAAPPPLPPSLPSPAVPATSAGKGGRTLVYGAVFVVLLAGAIGAGLAVGSYARARRAPAIVATAPSIEAPAPVPSAQAAAPVAAPAASASAPHALVLPTIEVSSPSAR
jgi:DNA polymerase-3 subunit gamma/tau